jgi:hypothetical protein
VKSADAAGADGAALASDSTLGTATPAAFCGARRKTTKAFHLTALRTNPAYRQFHKTIRGAQDAKLISETMKQAYEARQAGRLPLKHFTALKTAAELQRERLGTQQLSTKAFRLVQEIQSASEARLRYFSWAFYGTNQPAHVIHALPAQEQARVWATLKTRKEIVTQKVVRQTI